MKSIFTIFLLLHVYSFSLYSQSNKTVFFVLNFSTKGIDENARLQDLIKRDFENILFIEIDNYKEYFELKSDFGKEAVQYYKGDMNRMNREYNIPTGSLPIPKTANAFITCFFEYGDNGAYLKIGVWGIDGTLINEVAHEEPIILNVLFDTDKRKKFLGTAIGKAFTYERVLLYRKLSKPLQDEGKIDKLPTQTFEYTLPSIDGLPYGYFYYLNNNEVVKENALPLNISEMHTFRDDTSLISKNEINKSYGNKVSTMPKAAYSSVIANDTEFGCTVENVKLVVDNYSPLPDKSIFVWHRKGLMEKYQVQINFKSNIKEYTVFSGQNSVYHLKPYEGFPMNIDITNGDAGIYEFHLESIIIINGKKVTIRSENQKIAVPKTISSNCLNIYEIGTVESNSLKDILLIENTKFYNLVRFFEDKMPSLSEIKKKVVINSNIEPIQDSLDLILYNPKTINGIELIKEHYGADYALKKLSLFIKENPNVETGYVLKIKYLFAANQLIEAMDFLSICYNKYPQNSTILLYKWILEKETIYATRAIMYDPKNVFLYSRIADYYMIYDLPLPPNYFNQINFLSIDQRNSIADDLIVSMYKNNFGLSYTLDKINFLILLDKDIENLMWLLPEYFSLYKPKFDKLLHRSKTDAISLDFQSGHTERLVYVLIKSGRIELAKYYSKQTTTKELPVITHAFSFDFDFLLNYTYQDLKNQEQSLNSLEYIICGITLLEREQWKLYDALIEQYRKTYRNQTNLLETVYNSIKGNWELALYQYVMYTSQLSKFYFDDSDTTKTFFHPSELPLMQNLEIYRKLKSPDSTFQIKAELLKILLPINDFNDFTYWDIDYINKNKIKDVGNVFLYYVLLKKATENTNYITDSVSFVRIPNRVLVFNDINDKDIFSNLNLNVIKNVVENGEILFNSGIYGRKLMEKEINTSYVLHLAWYNYWNKGELDKALTLVNKAIELDSKFYDAYILKAKILLAKGEKSEAEISYKIAEQICLLPTKEKLIWSKYQNDEYIEKK